MVRLGLLRRGARTAIFWNQIKRPAELADRAFFTTATVVASATGRSPLLFNHSYDGNDPMAYEGGFHLYVYCTNDPVNKFDPHGLKSVWKEIVKKLVGKHYKISTEEMKKLVDEGKLYQVHHIISQKLFGKNGKESELSKWLNEMVDPEGGANKVILPTREGKQLDIPRGKDSPASIHDGGHMNEYYEMVQNKLKDIQSLYKAGKLTKEDAQAAIRGVQGEIRDGLKKGTVKLQKYDKEINEGELSENAARMSGLAIWAGAGIDEANERTEKAVDEYTSNQTYYRDKNQFSKYLTVGFYTHTSDNPYVKKAGEYAGYVDPVQNVLDTSDMAVDVANAAGEAAKTMRQVTTGAGNDIGSGEMGSRDKNSNYQAWKQLTQDPNAPVQQQNSQGGYLSDMWKTFTGQK